MANLSPKAIVLASQEVQTSSSTAAATAAAFIKSDDRSSPHKAKVMQIFKQVGINDHDVESYTSKDFYSNILCNTLKTNTVRRGHVSCFATVKPCISNHFGGLHGGAVAALAERVAIATARTVVGDDKKIFLVDLGMSYLSAAPDDVGALSSLAC